MGRNDTLFWGYVVIKICEFIAKLLFEIGIYIYLFFKACYEFITGKNKNNNSVPENSNQVIEQIAEIPPENVEPTIKGKSSEINPPAENTLVLYVTKSKLQALSRGYIKKYTRILDEKLFEDIFVFENGNPSIKKEFRDKQYSWNLSDRFEECPYITKSYKFVEFRNRQKKQTYITKINPEIVIYFSKHGKWAFRIDFI